MNTIFSQLLYCNSKNLTIPFANWSIERAFSELGGIKTKWWRSNPQTNLINLMVLCSESDNLDVKNINKWIEEFAIP